MYRSEYGKNDDDYTISMMCVIIVMTIIVVPIALISDYKRPDVVVYAVWGAGHDVGTDQDGDGLGNGLIRDVAKTETGERISREEFLSAREAYDVVDVVWVNPTTLQQ